MSLQDAVLEIAAQIDVEAEDLKGSAGAEYARTSLKGWARQLRTVVKAAEGSQQVRPQIILPGQKSLDALPSKAIRVAQEEIAAQHQRQEGGPRMVEIAAEGDSDVVNYVEVPGDMPVGARTEMAGRVYQLRSDGRLHLDEGMTKKLMESRGK